MTILEMLGQSGVLTILGMGIVFSFLVIMVISVTIMGKVIQALDAAKNVPAPGASAVAGGAGPAPSQAMGTAIPAAIAAAVANYQKDN